MLVLIGVVMVVVRGSLRQEILSAIQSEKSFETSGIYEKHIGMEQGSMGEARYVS